MERKLYEEEFEDFLKQKADQYRMFPSDKVWNGIYNVLHPGRRWFIVGGALLLITTLGVISSKLFYPRYQAANKNTVSKTISSKDKATTNSTTKSSMPLSSAPNYQLPVPIDQIGAQSAAREYSITTDKNNTILPVGKPLMAASIIGNTPSSLSLATGLHTIVPPEAKQKEVAVNWLEEMAVIKLTPAPRKRFNMQFYLSPTISYRSLQSVGQEAMPTTSGDVKGIVNHQPALGLEVGSALLFHVSENFILKSGFQFNYTRYNINAYKSSLQKAPITLSSTDYSRPSATETIITYSSLRNYNGGIPETIQNQYVQISLPIGAEWRLWSNGRMQWNVAGSVQPTYLMANNAYMLSSDYKSYTKEPSLVRRWNVNTGIETFLSYKAGGLRWQVGPQFRYQLLSTYTDRYPIREYLMEYGMKIGVSKTIR